MSYIAITRLSPLRFVKLTEVVLLVALLILLAQFAWSLSKTAEKASSSALSATQADRASMTAQSPASEPSSAVRVLFGTANDAERMAALPEPVRETPLQLVLKGILLQQDSDNRLALIERSDKQEKVYRQGDEVEGAQIVRIEPRRVVLRRNGQNESLSLKLQKLERLPVDAHAESPAVPAARVLAVSGDRLRSQLTDLPALLRQASTAPHEVNGEQMGFRVLQIENGSVFEELGLKADDVLRSVNGIDVRNSKDALLAYHKLRKADSFRLDLLRDGEQLTINYSIR